VFNPEEYFAHVERALNQWDHYRDETGLDLKIKRDGFTCQWELIIWRFDVRFPDGRRLDALETHKRGNNRQHLRKIKYQLRFPNGDLIFRVDCHQNAIPYDECPHIDLPNGAPRIDEGDPRLDGRSLRGMDFLRMIEWVNELLEKERLPWTV
jgi:hypothetical protein